ncbi:MAG: hypothetical protein AAB778_03310, partial [Patescibacteria group bacterium]
LIAQAEKRAQQKADIQAREKQTIDDFITKNQERIAKAQAVQDKLKDKVVYAKVIIPEPLPLDDIEKEDLSTLREYAQGSEETKHKLIEDLTKQIETRLENIPEEQKELIARIAAVEIVEKLAKPEEAYEVQIQHSILTAIHENKKEILKTVLQKDDDLLIAAKNGSTLLELEAQNKELTTKAIARNIFGPRLTLAIYGPEQFEVVLSETKVEGQTTHQVKIDELNLNYISELQNQNSVLTTLQQHGQQFGYDKINSVFTNYAGTFLKGKVESLPAGSLFKRAYKDPIVQSIFARYGMAEPVVWQAVGQSRFVGLVMKIAPDTAGPVLSLVSRITGKQLVAPIAAKVAGQAAGKAVAGKVAGQVAVKTGLAGFIAKIATAIGIGAGPATFGISAAVGWVIGEVVKKINWPKIKKWFQENGPVLAGVAGLGALTLGGPAVGGLVLFGGLAATGSLAAFATGAFGVFGFIGRSIGVAVATPVIVTLLVIPPLVAFIMLVINNSAYVVPPSPYSSSQNGGADNPYMLVTKTANPTKLDNSSSNQTVIYVVSITALKGNLTNLKLVSSECKVIKKDKSNVECPPESLPDIDGESVSPSSPKVFSFTGIYDSKYSDSLIYDTITISATNEAGEVITTSGSASVCIGDCPASCAEISDNAQPWPPNLKGNAIAGLGIISQYQGFNTKLCVEGKPINLCYNPPQIDEGYYAWHVHNKNGDNCDVYFNSKGVGNDINASFLITHELTHHIQKINGSETAKYLVSGGWIPEIVGKGFCTYKDTAGSYTEAMAEAAGLYVNIPSWGSCASNYSNKYPRNYNWAQGFMTK